MEKFIYQFLTHNLLFFYRRQISHNMLNIERFFAIANSKNSIYT